VCAAALGDELDDFDRMMAPRDKSKWVDPFDMGLGSAAAQDCSVTEEMLRKVEAEKVACEGELEKLSSTSTVKPSSCSTVNTLSKESKKPVVPPVPSEVFLKRYVSHLLSKLGLVGHVDSFGAHLKLEIQLTPTQIKTLQAYSLPASRIPPTDIDHILSSFIINVDTIRESPMLERLREHIVALRDPLVVLVLLLTIVYSSFMILRSLRPFYSALLVMVVSVSWHWLTMFKKAWAGKHAKLLKTAEIPPECRPHEMTWFQSLQSSGRAMFSSVDKCEEYHKTIMVDPIYEVNPMVAFVDLATTLILHPLASLGDNVGMMFSSLLEHVPFFWRPVILILFVVLIMFVLILLSGYRISLPFFLGEIGPAASSNSSADIQELKRIIQEQNVRQLQQMEHTRKMSAPHSLLEFRGSGLPEVEALQVSEGGGCLVLRTPSKEGTGARQRLLARSLSQVEDLTCMQREDIRKEGEQNSTIESLNKESGAIEGKVTGIGKISDGDIGGNFVTEAQKDECSGGQMVLPLKNKEASAENIGHNEVLSEYDNVDGKLNDDKIELLSSSNELLKTPVKKLVVVANNDSSPLETNFQWITVEKDGFSDNDNVSKKSEEHLKEIVNVFEK